MADWEKMAVPVTAGQSWEAAAIPFNSVLDRTRGAPANVRELVGGSSRPQDRLATIRKFYPDAQPFEDDNFVFTDPETKRPTLYNPKGLDWGDVPSVAREAATTVGAGLGTAAAVSGAIPTGGLGLVATPAMAGAGAVAAGSLYDTVRGFRGGVDTRGVGEVVGDAALEAGVNAAGQRLGETAPALIRQGLTSAKGMPAVQNTIQAFKNLGVSPTAGQATGNWLLQGLENAASKMPGGMTTAQNFFTKQLDDISAAASRIVNQYGPGKSAAQAGRALQNGVRSFVELFNAKGDDLYGQLDKYLPQETKVPAANLVRALSAQSDEFAAAPALGAELANPKLKGILEATISDMKLPPGTDPTAGVLPYNVIKALRSKIGAMLSDPSARADIPTMQLKQVYGALSEDMRAVAAQAGPEALGAFERANKFHAAGLTRIEGVLDSVVKQKIPEQALDAAMTASGKGGTRLMALRRSIPEDQWDIVASQVLRKMGMANPGAQDATGEVFSPAKFLTEWSKLDKMSRGALFRGTRYQDMAKQLDDLVEVSSTVKGWEKFANNSNTANTTAAQNLLTGVGGGALGALTGDLALTGGAGLGAVAAANIPAYGAMGLGTSPGFINWLTRGAADEPMGLLAQGSRVGTGLLANPQAQTRMDGLPLLFRPTPRAGAVTGAR